MGMLLYKVLMRSNHGSSSHHYLVCSHQHIRHTTPSHLLFYLFCLSKTTQGCRLDASWRELDFRTSMAGQPQWQKAYPLAWSQTHTHTELYLQRSRWSRIYAKHPPNNLNDLLVFPQGGAESMPDKYLCKQGSFDSFPMCNVQCNVCC